LVDVSGSQGVQIGDHGIQHNDFRHPSPRRGQSDTVEHD
jgi:hypothetical protein